MKRKSDTSQKFSTVSISESGIDYEDDDVPLKLTKTEPVKSRTCPYLDTINRLCLDFDFEKLCSVSLSHLNAYACLVCGKYFQGRGKSTHAYTHSVDTDHRVFLNLSTFRFYCLPDNYEIVDSSLEDITYVLNPTYSNHHIAHIDSSSKLSRSIFGTTYYPGIVGLNNIKSNDYCNVVLQALSIVPPLRDYFLQEENYSKLKRPPGDKMIMLTQRFGELIRKLWNPRNFKSHVSPHEMLQAVVLCSDKRFQITQQGDALDFMSWLLNSLHAALNGTKKLSSSIIYKTFRGKVRVFSRKILPVDVDEVKKRQLQQTEEYQEKSEEIPFVYLTLDLPPAPLYRDEFMQNIIPQVPLGNLLTKYNGVTEHEYKTYKDNFMKRFVIIQLPRFLIMYVKRFQKNNWFREKNPTIVNFPIKNVDMYECLAEDVRDKHQYTTYDLIANIVHDGSPELGKGTYRVQVHHRGTDEWFELEDLHVKSILPQTITLTETYIQVYQLNTTRKRDETSSSISSMTL